MFVFSPPVFLVVFWSCKNMLVHTWWWPLLGSPHFFICTSHLVFARGHLFSLLECVHFVSCFLMVTEFILLGWMSSLVWVSPSQMPIRQLWLLITYPPLGLRSSGSHTWLHPDYILPPARFVWLFMGRVVLRRSRQKVLQLTEKRMSRSVPNLDLTALTTVFYVKSKEVMTVKI